ncbi:MAG: tetratricopeptide repeat protein [Deltaproteobacteria bacterium]|nr:tetratricopeptide repeat protein [Deltaproteobacteria bacterium]
MARFRFSLAAVVLILLAVAVLAGGRLSPEKNAKYYFDQGTEHMHRGRYQAALRDLTRAIELDPNYDKAYRQRGNVYFRMGDYDRALADYNRARRVTPGLGRNYYLRALVYLKLGKLEEALTELNLAIAWPAKRWTVTPMPWRLSGTL